MSIVGTAVGRLTSGIIGASATEATGEIQLVGVTSTQWASGTGAKTIAKPSGLEEGDLLISFLTHRNSIVALPTGGATWIEKTHWSVGVTNITEDSSQNDRCYIWYKIAGASEPATYSISYTDSGSDGACWIVMAFRNADTVGSYAATGTTTTSPAVTATEGDCLICWQGTVFDSSATIPTEPAGMIPDGGVHNGSGDVGLVVAHEFDQSVGSTGTKAWTSLWATYDIAGSILIR